MIGKLLMRNTWTVSPLSTSVLCASLLCAVSSPSYAAEMLSKGGYAERPLSVTEGTLRIDIGPSDFAYMDFGELNDGRAALEVIGYPGGTSVYSGVGAALGVVEDLEVGALLFPIPIHPNFDFGNMEAYARYQITHGTFQLGAQGTIQIPTAQRFGVGLGLPMRIFASDAVRIDTGLEVEIMARPGDVHLDVPLAVAFDIDDVFFIGPRTGARIIDMRDFQMPAGLFLGGEIADMVDLTGSFVFWNFVNTETDRAIDFRVWEALFGVTVFVDVY